MSFIAHIAVATGQYLPGNHKKEKNTNGLSPDKHIVIAAREKN